MAYPTTPSTATDLLTSLPDKFERARSSGELLFFESSSKDVHSGGRRFNVRCCPALQDKAKAKAEALASVGAEPQPKRQKQEQKSEGAEGEPFRPPYIPELYVGCLDGLEKEEGMSILLNKYALLPNHILLCPPTSQPQSLPPTPHQLALAYTVLVASARHPTRPRKLLAFYNGGPGAGASQTWRHLQFIEIGSESTLPLEEWTREITFERTDRALVHPTLPYLHITHPLAFPGLKLPLQGDDEEKLVDALAPALMQCLDLGIDAVRRGNGRQDGGWNLLMTLDHLHLVPRSAPSFPLADSSLELNSLGYAGMLLVRSEEEEAALTAATQEKGLVSALEACGVPRQWGEDAVRAAEAVQGHAEWS
ncbi:ATP adenylyltransferase-domain-containing protein [Dioszegia hungarica]|uniref:ATP adenylyltransferase-domain-containing protein n=1 Tax=Dioszegia hungarica TaxID=4972 RepID=A0AA38H3P6_9TREE|nr:ATP adenylyltransferase-domain-containing protein [Dioszegia hungarica]KAI9632126.1 ATP adenylyltransferase-domain-containing protein [Dioszegia hungarica]